MAYRPAHTDPEGETPWAMQLVVDVTDRTGMDAQDVLEAAAQAVTYIRDQSVQSGQWSDEFARWEQGLIRKVVRRAKNSRWNALQTLDGVTVTRRSATVRAFVPTPVDQVPEPIRKLQVSGLDVPYSRGRWVQDGPALRVMVNPAVEASVGKLAAQTAHAAHIAHMQSPDSAVRRWRDSGFAVNIAVPSLPDRWDTFVQSAQVHVQDAGFTEVPPGTFTVAASWDSLQHDREKADAKP